MEPFKYACGLACFGGKHQDANRVAELNDGTGNSQHHFLDNRTKTAKYNPITFLPRALFEQYRYVVSAPWPRRPSCRDFGEPARPAPPASCRRFRFIQSQSSLYLSIQPGARPARPVSSVPR